MGKVQFKRTTSLAMNVSTCWMKSLFLAIPCKERISMQLSTERCLIRYLTQMLATLSIFKFFAAKYTAFT